MASQTWITRLSLRSPGDHPRWHSSFLQTLLPVSKSLSRAFCIRAGMTVASGSGTARITACVLLAGPPNNETRGGAVCGGARATTAPRARYGPPPTRLGHRQHTSSMPPMKSGTTLRKAIAKSQQQPQGPAPHGHPPFNLLCARLSRTCSPFTQHGGAENESGEGSMKDGASKGGVDAAKRDVHAEVGWVDEGDSEDDSTAVLVGRRSVRNGGAVDVHGMWKSFQAARHAQMREKQAEQERARSVQEQMKAEQARAVESAAEAEARKKQEREAQRAADRARREAERMGSGIDLMGQANLMKSFEAGASGGGADDLSFDSFG